MAIRQTAEGAWDDVYAGNEDAWAYGGLESYRLGAELLAGCDLIEDWGCGAGAMRCFVDHQFYRGIDGSASPFADEVHDLASYRSRVPAVFMRHVLEHDWRWETILDNAIASFQERMVLVLFTANQRRTREIGVENATGVPVIGFRMRDVRARFDCPTEVIRLPAESGPGWHSVYDETVIYAER